MNFDGIAVNDALKAELNAMEKSRRMPHAIIISGGDGQSRESLSRHLAMWAVCDSSHKPCGECRACLKAQSKNHMDIYYAKGRGKTDIIPVDEVRNIIRCLSYPLSHVETLSFVIPCCRNIVDDFKRPAKLG